MVEKICSSCLLYKHLWEEEGNAGNVSGGDSPVKYKIVKFDIELIC